MLPIFQLIWDFIRTFGVDAGRSSTGCWCCCKLATNSRISSNAWVAKSIPITSRQWELGSSQYSVVLATNKNHLNFANFEQLFLM